MGRLTTDAHESVTTADTAGCGCGCGDTEPTAPTVALTPDPDAKRLADALLDDDETQRQLLAETIGDGNGRMYEAGRTVCTIGGEPQAPLDRSTGSVDLVRCDPGERTGIYHTHPSPMQLADPDHSLVDYALVAFEGVDASIVVGTETSSVVVAGDDREAQQQAFRDAVGVDVTTARDVAAAIRGGTIGGQPAAAARQRVGETFGATSYRVETPHPAIASQIEDYSPAAGAVAAAAPSDGALTCCSHAPPQRPLQAAAAAREQARAGGEVLAAVVMNTRVSDIVIGTLIGDLTSTAVQRVIFE